MFLAPPKSCHWFQPAPRRQRNNCEVESFSRHQEEAQQAPVAKLWRRFEPPSDFSGGEPGTGSEPTAAGLRETAHELADRIDEILRTAEQTADEIRREAEESAQRYLEQRRAAADREAERRAVQADRELVASATAVAQLSTSLRAQAARVLDELGGLERAARAALDAAAEPGGTPPVADVREAGGETPAGSEPEARSREADDGGPQLRAAQLALQGSTREEIERVLRLEFGLQFPEQVVTEILGESVP